MAAAVLTSLLAFLSFLCLNKRPFCFQATLDALNAVDLDLLHDFEILENRADMLDALAQPFASISTTCTERSATSTRGVRSLWVGSRPSANW